MLPAPMAALAVYPASSSAEGGRLAVGGCDAVELARTHGTPAFVMAEADLRANARTFRDALAAHHDGTGEVIFASKACPATAVLRVFAAEGLGVDVASGGELHLALRAGYAESKLGMDPRDARALANDPPPHLDVRGFHFHLGSQLADPTPYRAAVGVVAGLGEHPVYSLGGGFAVAYTPDDRPPSVDEAVAAVVEAAREALGPGKHLVLEPGRSLVANAGVTLYTVESVKELPGGGRIVAVDGGMSDNPRPMLYDAVYDVRVADRFEAAGEPATVVGKHCESGDVLVRRTRLPDPRPGDVLVTAATGAYGHAMASNYNGIRRPPVVFCREGRARVVIRRETYEDLSARDV